MVSGYSGSRLTSPLATSVGKPKINLNDAINLQNRVNKIFCFLSAKLEVTTRQSLTGYFLRTRNKSYILKVIHEIHVFHAVCLLILDSYNVCSHCQ